MPYSDFVQIPGAIPPGMIPNAVVGKRIMEEVSMLQAWREHLMLTQTEMAERMGITVRCRIGSLERLQRLRFAFI